MLLVALLACSDPPPPFEPRVDAAWTAATVDALCKVVEGGGGTCAREGDTASFAGRKLRFQVWSESEVEQFGMLTMRGRADLEVDGAAVPALRTPVRAFGGNRKEATDRAVHEWAVVYGVGLADWASADAGRAALKAVDPHNHAVPAADHHGGTLYRGWPLVRGSKDPLDHDATLASLLPVMSKWTGGPHAVVLEVAAEPEGVQRTLWVDGAPSDALADAVKATRFAGESGVQLRQFYVWDD